MKYSELKIIITEIKEDIIDELYYRLNHLSHENIENKNFKITIEDLQNIINGKFYSKCANIFKSDVLNLFDNTDILSENKLYLKYLIKSFKYERPEDYSDKTVNKRRIFKDNELISIINNQKDTILSKYYIENNVIKEKEYTPIVTYFETDGLILVNDSLFDIHGIDPNDLEKEYPNKSFYGNETIGLINTTKCYGEKNILHGFVGNSCPTLFYSKEEERIIIGVEYDDEDNPILPNNSYKKLINICIDLWWYTILNYNDYKDKVNIDDYQTVEITAGRWKLEHTYGITSSDRPYATLTLVK